MAATAAILAGGKGTRFHPYTEIIPKPLIPLGSEEKPILEYIVCWLARHGVSDIVLLLGHRWRSIVNYFGCGGRWGVRIRYSIDDDKYSNTGGALLKAYERGLLNGTTIVWYGDIMAPLNLEDLLSVHQGSGAAATIVVAARYRVPVGVAVVRDGYIAELREKPWLDMNVTIGILALEPSVLREAGEELGTRFDIMGDMIPWMLRRGYPVKAYVYGGPWWDVGSLERYKKINLDDLCEFISACKGFGEEAEIY